MCSFGMAPSVLNVLPAAKVQCSSMAPACITDNQLKLLKFGFAFTGTEAAILIVGMVTAFVVSVLAIKFLMGYIKKNNFKPFGYYRIALGVLVLAYFIFLG